MTAGPFSIGSDVWPGTSKVIEETGELQQVLGKLIALGGETAHWDGTDLRQRMVEEIGDVRAALRFFEHINDLPSGEIAAREHEKFLLFSRWQEEQA